MVVVTHYSRALLMFTDWPKSLWWSQMSWHQIDSRPLEKSVRVATPWFLCYWRFSLSLLKHSYVLASWPTPSPINVLERNRWAIPATSYKWYHIRFHQSICCFLYSLLKLHHKENIKAAQNCPFQDLLYKKYLSDFLKFHIFKTLYTISKNFL